MIEFEDLRVSYGKSEILKGISARFPKGELISIIGPNGAGKTTLLKALMGMVTPETGRVTVEGDAPCEMKRDALARQVAYLSQGKGVPDMTVERLVLHGRFPHLKYPRVYREKDFEIAEGAMARMELSHLAKRPLSTLSGGMRQRAYIAMALAQCTEYILLDEPTTHLDISHRLELMGALGELAAEGKGVVTVIHDLPLAFTFSKRIALLCEGHLAAFDTPENLCRSGIISRVFGVELAVSEEGGAYFYRY